MDNSLAGMYGEAIVLTCLLSWGYPATLVSGPLSYDILVDIYGQSYKVQVKATNRECPHGEYESSLSFNIDRGSKFEGVRARYTTGSYDILACVSLLNNKILFMPFTKKVNIRRKVSTFTKKRERESWVDCLDHLKKKD